MTVSHRLPPLKALQAFEAAGRRGSFQAAALELSVTQAAVAQQVRQLEERLGFPLFLRQRRGVQLSERGRPPRPRFAGAGQRCPGGLHPGRG